MRKVYTLFKMKMQPWIKAIPESPAHGSGTFQKRLWRLVSDYVRLRDFLKYKRCVATDFCFTTWGESQAGHFKSYSTCNGMFKFDPINIHAQSAPSNSWGGMETGQRFADELRRRYGTDYIQKINDGNRKYQGTNIRDSIVIEYMEKILEMMAELPEQPIYYERVITLRNKL